MRERLYFIAGLVLAGLLLYAGRDYLPGGVLLTWGLTFAGATGISVLIVALYRVQIELKESRHEITRNQAELGVALEVQQGLFPQKFPDFVGLEFSGVCIPARGIGGDYYDVIEYRDGRILFAIADIAGKGVSAAILMSNLQALLRTLVEITDSPSEICARLNNHLFRVTEPARFATFFCADWNPTTESFRYVNAGHNLPILIGSQCDRRLDCGGFPLGLFCDAEFETGECLLRPGDLLVLYSDGITEKGESRGFEFGEARLRELAEAHRDRPLAEIQERILEAVRAWQGPELEDDMTMVLVRAARPKEAR